MLEHKDPLGLMGMFWDLMVVVENVNVNKCLKFYTLTWVKIIRLHLK